MNEVRDWLKDADPVGHEPPLSDVDVQRMRRAIVAAGEAAPSRFVWSRGSWAAASVVVVLTIVLSVSRWAGPGEETRAGVATPTGVAVPEASTRRQVQLIAPGGTRVIWIFNDEFQP
jgi:hypothetical protein